MINHNSIDQSARPVLTVKHLGVEEQILQSFLFFVITIMPIPVVYIAYMTCPW